MHTLNWYDVQHEVRTVNPELCQLIDSLAPSKTLKLLKLRYHYGELITKNGRFQPALENLQYSNIPLFLPLNRAIEVFVDHSDQAIPMNVLMPGELVGLFETVDSLLQRPSLADWCVSAGCRTLCLLPKITNQLKLQKLVSTYDCHNPPSPRTLSNQWELFSQLMQHPNNKKTWHLDILVFTNDWFEQTNFSPIKWHQFKDYVIKKAWHTMDFALQYFNTDLLWPALYDSLIQRRCKPSFETIERVKNLIMLANGKFPGMRPNLSDLYAPISQLQTLLRDDYGLDHHPTFMHSMPLNTLQEKLPLYYSFAYPTHLTKTTHRANQTTKSRELQTLLFTLDTIKQSEQCQQHLQHTDFHFFHVDTLTHPAIKTSKMLMAFDPALHQACGHCPKSFAVNSSFWKGCIAIQKN